MSKTIKIQTRATIDFQQLYDFILETDNSIVAIGRSPDIVYFYSEGHSTRGVDVYKQDTGYKIRLTVMANYVDYQLADNISRFFTSYISDAILWFQDKTIDSMNTYIQNEFCNHFKKDIDFINQLSIQHQKPITLFAANQEYYLGEYSFAKIDMHNLGWEVRTEQLIQNILYKLPKSESDHTLRIGEGENQKTAKLVSHDVSYILKKYDALLFNKSKDSNQMNDLLFITNDVLNSNLPQSWNRIDDYTIIAPALGLEMYLKWVEKMNPFHQPELF